MTVGDQHYCHKSNLLQKRKTANTSTRLATVKRVEKRFERLQEVLKWRPASRGWLANSVDALNEYVDFVKAVEKSDSFFNWRSDFASSVLPEFLCRMLGERLRRSGAKPLFSTRQSVVDLTLSGYREGGWVARRKNQDLCIGLRTDTIVINGDATEFVVPLLVLEAKTNIDINKLNGLEFSADRLKRTFPASRYLLVTETVDFSLAKNYSGAIDEIFVLRKQMRSKARREKAPMCADVFENLAEYVCEFVRRADVPKTHVYERLESGRLINV